MENLLQIEREMAVIREKQASAEEQHKTIFRRLDKQEKLIDSVHSLATSQALLAEEQARQGQQLSGLCGDVAKIKEKPIKTWEGIVEKILMTIVGALVMFALAKIGLV